MTNTKKAIPWLLVSYILLLGVNLLINGTSVSAVLTIGGYISIAVAVIYAIILLLRENYGIDIFSIGFGIMGYLNGSAVCNTAMNPSPLRITGLGIGFMLMIVLFILIYKKAK
ncbi:MAG: hypothetical protein ACRC26_11225 [Bacteroidales bacterium]